MTFTNLPFLRRNARVLGVARCAFVAAWIVASAMPTPASAHAYVVVSTPSANATLETGPQKIGITFDEPVTLESRRPLDVVDARGGRHSCATVGMDPNDATRLQCTLDEPLPRGAYTVRWRVTSADTHPIDGAFSFGVGVAVAGPSEAAPDIDWLGIVARWLVLAGIAAAGGVLLFDRLSAPLPAAGRIAGFGIGLGLVAGLGSLVLQCAAASGSSFAGAIVAIPAICKSTWGLAWFARTFALLGAAVAVTYRDRFASNIAIAAIAIALLTLSSSGHALDAATGGTRLALVLADWLHACAASAWIGGIVALCALPRGSLNAATLARFTRIALAATATIVITGVTGAIVHVGTLAALTGTIYGRLILAKVVLLSLLAVPGYSNLRRGRGAPLTGLSNALRAELASAIIILLLSAALAAFAPARALHAGSLF